MVMTYQAEQECRAFVKAHIKEHCFCHGDKVPMALDVLERHNLAATSRVALNWWWRICASFGVFI